MVHEPLRQIFKKLENDYEKVISNLLLKISVDVMNETSGVNGLSFSRLGFEATPKFAIMIDNFHKQ